MEHTVLLNNGQSVSLVGELQLVGDFFVLSNERVTYRFHWKNVAYCRTKNKDSGGVGSGRVSVAPGATEHRRPDVAEDP
jgi:hypothetical protein